MWYSTSIVYCIISHLIEHLRICNSYMAREVGPLVAFYIHPLVPPLPLITESTSYPPSPSAHTASFLSSPSYRGGGKVISSRISTRGLSGLERSTRAYLGMWLSASRLSFPWR